MRENYKESKLIQRGKMNKIKKNEVTGFSSAFDLDYMGSSEFEDGSVHLSLKGIISVLDSYEKFQDKRYTSKKTAKNVFVFCLPVDREFALTQIERIYNKTVKLQDRSEFPEALAENDKFCDTNLWWDIQHNFMFVLGKPVLQRLIFSLEKLRERWTREGKI